MKEQERQTGEAALISGAESVSGTVRPTEETERCARMEVVKILNMVNVSDSLLPPEYIMEKDVSGFLDMIRTYFITYPKEYDELPDVQEMNAYIRKLSYTLCRSVREGTLMEANASIAGICNGKEIHENLLFVKEIYQTNYAQYFDSCRRYMRCYIALTGISKRIDEVGREVEIYKNKLDGLSA